MIIQTIAPPGGWLHTTGNDVAITNTEIDGGIYFDGTGTLTLHNDVIKPDGAKVWATVAAVNGGSVVIDHTTIAAYNVGVVLGQPKGVAMGGSGTLDFGYVDETGICQNDLGLGSVNIHDSYIHDIGSGNGATCHATAVEAQFGATGSIVIQHNTIDEFPGLDFRAGDTGAIFLQGNYGHVPQITIDNNYLHGAYAPIEISQGAYGVTEPNVVNNCLAWPAKGRPIIHPSVSTATWSANTVCDKHGKDTGRRIARA